MTSRMPNADVNSQDQKDNIYLMKSNNGLNGIQSKDELVRSVKKQLKFGVNNQKYNDQQEQAISRTMSELKVVKHTHRQALQKIKSLVKHVTLHAFVKWVGDHFSWIVEKLSDFAEMIKDFVKDNWEQALDW